MPGEDKLEGHSSMNAKVEKGMSSSKMKRQQVESLYAPTMVPKAPDKWGIVNVSSKRQVERLPVDNNDDEVFTLPHVFRTDSARNARNPCGIRVSPHRIVINQMSAFTCVTFRAD